MVEEKWKRGGGRAGRRGQEERGDLETLKYGNVIGSAINPFMASLAIFE